MALSTHSHNQGQKVLKCLALKVLDILIDESCQLRKKSVDMHITDFAYHSWISLIKSPDFQLSAFRDCCFLFVAGEELVFEHCVFLGNVSLTFDYLFLGTLFD